MLETLQQIDTEIFLALIGANCPWLDNFMWYFSGKWIWIPLYVAIAAAIVYRYGWLRAIGLLIVIGLIITVCDQLCGHWVRDSIQRLRPSNLSNPISDMVHIVNGNRAGAYGFPSCHAANSFALATFISLLMRNRAVTAIMLLWAIVTAYSRIILGVHYPGDLLAGAIAGTAVSLAAYYSSRAIYRRYPCRGTRGGTLPVKLIGYTAGVLTAGMSVMAILAC